MRYGNGVECYGGCANFVVDNCWIYQIYDAGVTFQYGTEMPDISITMETVHFTNNLLNRLVGITLLTGLDEVSILGKAGRIQHHTLAVFVGNGLEALLYGIGSP